VIELDDHPFFVASQFHPEFKSRPERPAPLFRDFLAAALEHAAALEPSAPLEHSATLEPSATLERSTAEGVVTGGDVAPEAHDTRAASHG